LFFCDDILHWFWNLNTILWKACIITWGDCITEGREFILFLISGKVLALKKKKKKKNWRWISILKLKEIERSKVNGKNWSYRYRSTSEIWTHHHLHQQGQGYLVWRSYWWHWQILNHRRNILLWYQYEDMEKNRK